MEMSLRSQTFDKFVEALIQKDYPEDCIKLHWSDYSHKIDIAILDKTKSYIIAIYRVSTHTEHSNFSWEIDDLRRFRNYLNYDIIAGIVEVLGMPPYFNHYYVSDQVNCKKEEKKSKKDSYLYKACEILTYEGLQKTFENKSISTQINKAKKLDDFKKIVWSGITPVVGILWILDWIGIYDITYERIITLGIIILLIILPFFSEITIANFFSFKKQKNKNR